MPIPAVMLDCFLALNIGLSLLVLLVIIYVKDPPEFSGFPTLLLALTLFRLALNISSTRQVLVHGYAGHVIDAFGHFVIQGNYIVGAVVFVILVIINFVVITKGAGRIAEVAARFTLDALPGKQMAIDAELNAGIIDEVTATSRRLKVQKEADFYGAMDGASKFVRGDAIAGIIITLVNVIGGFAIGVFQMDLSLAEALQKFTLLSIGDGLVSQIPALILSVGAGILVTRASANTNLGTQLANQLFRYPRAMKIAAGMLLLFGLMPGMPLLPFVGLAAVSGYLAKILQEQEAKDGHALGDAPVPTAGRRGAKGKPQAGEAVGARPQPRPPAARRMCASSSRLMSSRSRSATACFRSPTPRRVGNCWPASPVFGNPSPARRASSSRPFPCATISSSSPTTTGFSCAANMSLAASFFPVAGSR